ncbi:hypothetical protein PMJ10TS2_74210 [Paenibacillus melissococcoides]
MLGDLATMEESTGTAPEGSRGMQALTAERGKQVAQTVNESALKRNTRLQNKYRIGKVVSSGELSIVYKARHMESGSWCVIKEFFPQALARRDRDRRSVRCRVPGARAQFEEQRAIFAKEGPLLAQLSHPCIVEYVDQFEEGGTVYLVTAYCPGMTLAQYIREGQAPSQARFYKETMLPIIDALEYIHRQGLIHRDIKPGNIIIDREGQPKLIDFGSAVHYEAGGRQPIFTTAGYSALELYSETSRQDPAADIYSLAATLYFCLCGQPPLDVTQRLFRDQVEPIRQRSRGTTPLLARVITKGLAIHSRKRPASLNPFRIALYAEHLKWTLKERLQGRRLPEQAEQEPMSRGGS